MNEYAPKYVVCPACLGDRRADAFLLHADPVVTCVNHIALEPKRFIDPIRTHCEITTVAGPRLVWYVVGYRRWVEYHGCCTACGHTAMCAGPPMTEYCTRFEEVMNRDIAEHKARKDAENRLAEWARSEPPA